jgi:cellulose synthase operon protein C
MNRRALPPLPRTALALALVTALALAACSTPSTLPGDDAPTLARLMQQPPPQVATDPGEPVDEARAIAAYQAFLQQAPASALAPQVPLALRRLGDLEMDLADRRAAESAADSATADPDYTAAAARYQALLRAHPGDAGNDLVLYQLARAQEQAGQMEAALATLTQLVASHPHSAVIEEAQFRRGEMLFALARYADAERAYAQVLAVASAAEASASAFGQRALYMQGWSRFKQGAMEAALPPLLAVLDTRLAPHAGSTAALADLPGLSRADRELVEDTLRVASIALANLEGGASIAALAAGTVREAWRWRLFDALASLYGTQDRPKDAADTLALFAQLQPLHAQAPVLLSRVVDIHERAGFASLALQAKTDYVERYGDDSAFRRANPAGWEAAQPLVQTHLEALARHHHALAQAPKLAGADKAAAQIEAVRWYRLWLASYPDHPRTPGLHFLLAELLFEAGRPAEAATAFEAVAYRTADAAPVSLPAPRAEAGYAALLAHAALVKAAPDTTARATAQQASADSALRFADAFPHDARSTAVLVDRADTLFALAQPEAAAQAAQRALAQPGVATPTQRRTAHTVLAHTAFERGDHAEAEAAYAAALADAQGDSPGAAAGPAVRAALAERQAIAIYRQGESARDAGDWRAAVGHFGRVATVAALAPAAALRATAEYDTAAGLVQLQDWPAAAQALEAFRRSHPQHPLQAQLPTQLAAVYLGQQRWADAATEFDRIAAASNDAEVARSARWQVADLFDKALADSPPVAASAPPQNTRAQRTTAAARRATRQRAVPALPPAAARSAAAWERYVAAHPQPLEPALEARLRWAGVLAAQGQPDRALALQQQVLDTERRAGDARTLRSRQLGGQAALALAEPAAAAYRSVALVEPLARQLKLKKDRLQTALAAYSVAAEAGVADVTTAATFHTAALYQDFGQALMQSQRPKKLTALQREQYDVMLEEQAYPFEEQAITLHESNSARSATGLWGPWVQRSFEALAKLKPARYGKTEELPGADQAGLLPPLQQALVHRQAGRLPEAVTTLEAAVLGDDTAPATWITLGVLYRESGRFIDAQRAYESALAATPADLSAQRNLAILFDLYLNEPARALPLYQSCLTLAATAAPAEAPTYTRWVAEVQRRVPAAASTAAAPADANANAAAPALTQTADSATARPAR